MERFVACASLVLTFIAVPHSATAAEAIPTRCSEVEIPLDDQHSVARFGPCDEHASGDLLWHLDRVDQLDGELDGRFDRQNRGAGAVAYVMDTGVMASHSEFARPDGSSRVIDGIEATASLHVGNSNCRSDDKSMDPCFANYKELIAASHGTSVASLIAGNRVGVAPEALIVSVRVMNERGLATTRTYLDALNAIIDHAWDPDTPPFRTAVINISGWVLEKLSNSDGMPFVPFSIVEKKIREMVDGVNAGGAPDPNGKRFLFVVAGNNIDGGCGRSGTVDRFPAILGPKIDGLITVGGMTENNDWWVGSCKGSVEILAPAQSIFSATITADDEYRGHKPDLRSGTSFAAPIISGIAARLLADRPDLTPAQLEEWITSSPSHISNPTIERASGKVGYYRETQVVAGR